MFSFLIVDICAFGLWCISCRKIPGSGVSMGVAIWEGVMCFMEVQKKVQDQHG